MEHVDDRVPPHCNGHDCDGRGELRTVSDRVAYVSRDSTTTRLQIPSVRHMAAAASTDCRSAAFSDEWPERKRKLVLHFDVRNTILVSDSATHDNVEQALNSFLTGVTWGREDNNGWVWCSDRPSLRAPCPGAITYYKSRERELVKTPADRVRLRRITGDFTRQPIGQKFRDDFDAHLRLLEWNVSPLSSSVGYDAGRSVEHHIFGSVKPEMVSVDRKLTIVGSNGRLYHYLLPSFVKMLYDLHADGRRFAVVLRTYGVDAPKVLDSIAHITAGHHPVFPCTLPMRVNRHPGRVRRDAHGRIQCELPPEIDVPDITPPVVLDSDTDIYQYMSDIDGVCGFVDDFTFWQDHNYTHSDGKPLWIDPADSDVQHIFFDDNIRVADAESIVDVRLFEDGRVSTTASGCCCITKARSLSIDEMAALEDVCLVQADLLECTSNVDYFISKVRQCERNYSEWLRLRQRSQLRCLEPEFEVNQPINRV